MSNLPIWESSHWVKPVDKPKKRRVVLKTAAQIEAEVRDDPKNNAINNNELWHRINMAVAQAKKNGKLIAEVGTVIEVQ